nr:MAG TPA: hypothetical protein [Bacteriophage sp.]
MGKTCLDKLPGNILVACDIPSNGVKDLYLMHAEDVQVTLDSTGGIASVEFSEGTRSYRIEGFKQNIQITSALRASDASAKLDFSVMFKTPSSVNGTSVNFRTERSFMCGRFYALVVLNSSAVYFIGDVSPLECSELDYDSNANGGLITITLTAPEGSAGNYRRSINQALASTIISKSA